MQNSSLQAGPEFLGRRGSPRSFSQAGIWGLWNLWGTYVYFIWNKHAEQLLEFGLGQAGFSEACGVSLCATLGSLGLDCGLWGLWCLSLCQIAFSGTSGVSLWAGVWSLGPLGLFCDLALWDWVASGL